jgi:hypothetical protein
MSYKNVAYSFTSHSSALQSIEMIADPWHMVLNCNRDNRYLRVTRERQVMGDETRLAMSRFSVRIIGRGTVNYYAFANAYVYLRDGTCVGPFERSNNFSIRYLVESLCLTAKNIKYGKR